MCLGCLCSRPVLSPSSHQPEPSCHWTNGSVTTRVTPLAYSSLTIDSMQTLPSKIMLIINGSLLYLCLLWSKLQLLASKPANTAGHWTGHICVSVWVIIHSDLINLSSPWLFPWPEVPVFNSTELFHTEHIWHPRIREVRQNWIDMLFNCS